MSPVALTSHSATPAADARQLAELKLLDLSGDEVRMGELWLEQPAVLSFLRHYG